MGETDAQVQRQPPADAPVILHERLIARRPPISHRSHPFAVSSEVPETCIGKTVLEIVGHGRVAAEAITTQVGSRCCLLAFCVSLPIDARLEIVRVPRFAERIVESINVVEIRKWAGFVETSLARLLPASKTNGRDGNLEILTARRQARGR